MFAPRDQLVAARPGRGLAALVVAVSLLSLSACGNRTPTDFSTDVKKSFLEGCSSQTSESGSGSKVAPAPKGACECAYGKLSKDKAQFDTFKKANDRLQNHPNESLPSDLYDLVKGCDTSQATTS